MSRGGSGRPAGAVVVVVVVEDSVAAVVVVGAVVAVSVATGVSDGGGIEGRMVLL